MGDPPLLDVGFAQSDINSPVRAVCGKKSLQRCGWSELHETILPRVGQTKRICFFRI